MSHALKWSEQSEVSTIFRIIGPSQVRATADRTHVSLHFLYCKKPEYNHAVLEYNYTEPEYNHTEPEYNHTEPEFNHTEARRN